MRRFFALDSAMSGALSQPWLFAVTVYVWTAFEYLAADLWVSAVNHAPGLGHHVLTSISNDDDDSGISKRHIEVRLAAKYGFDLRKHLGFILKGKFDFTTYQGILKAYEKAFGPCQEVRQYADELKYLEQMRHLIVHRGGIADDRFIKLSKSKLRPNAILRIPLKQLRDSVIAMTLASVALLHTVDSWATSNN